MTAKVDILILAGQPLIGEYLFWTWNDRDDDTGILTPKDLTGSTARLQIRPDFDSETTLASWTTENGKLILGGAAGTIAPNIGHAEAASMWNAGLLPSGVEYQGRTCYDLGYFDLEIIDAGGIPRRLLQGRARIVPEATR